MAAKEQITITCSTEDLDAKLSKSMKELGAHHDQYGRLVNAEGKFIAGLSQAQIKMGDYIDTQGKMRNAQGQLIEGLTATERKLRFYIDELGNIRSAEGEIIRVTAERQAQLDKEAQAAVEASQRAQNAEQERLDTYNRGLKQITGSAKKITKMANSLSTIVTLIGNGSGEMDKFGRSIVIGAQAFAQFSLWSGTLPKIIRGLNMMRAATQGQTMAQVVLNAVTGNWVTLAAGAAAAGVAAVAINKMMKSSTDDASKSLEKSIEYVDKLAVAYRKLGEDVEKSLGKVGTAISGGITSVGVSEVEILEEKIKDIDALYDKWDARNNERQEWVRNNSTASWGEQKQNHDQWLSDVGEIQNEINERSNDLAKSIAQLAAEDLPKDEMETLKERLALYDKILEDGNLTQDAVNTVTQARANVEGKIQKILDERAETERKAEEEAQKEEEAKRKQAEAEEAAAQAVKDNAAKALTSSGFDRFAQGILEVDSELESFNATVETWRENFEKAGKTQEEFDAAVKGLTESFNAKKRDKFLQENGLNNLLVETKTPLQTFNETIAKVDEAVEKYGLNVEDAGRMRKEAERRLNDALAKQAEQEEQARQSRLSELGITGLRESQKTDYDRYLAQYNNVMTALREGLIDQTEAQSLNSKLIEDYLETIGGEVEEEEAEQEKPKTEDYKQAQSATAGSQALYTMLTTSYAAQYQNTVKRNLESMNRYTIENNDNLKSMNDSLNNIQNQIGVI